MAMRGLRGATTVSRDGKEEIWQAAKVLMEDLLQKNDISSEVIGAAIFSMTEDLTAAFPSTGVRSLPGFDMVPLFDARQCAIEGSLPRCIRVLLLIDTDKGQQELRHVYQAEAAALRPDLIK